MRSNSWGKMSVGQCPEEFGASLECLEQHNHLVFTFSATTGSGGSSSSSTSTTASGSKRPVTHREPGSSARSGECPGAGSEPEPPRGERSLPYSSSPTPELGIWGNSLSAPAGAGQSQEEIFTYVSTIPAHLCQFHADHWLGPLPISYLALSSPWKRHHLWNNRLGSFTAWKDVGYSSQVSCYIEGEVVM
ncbi:uncharacterized protein LOC128826928 isoform X1 [Malaclemys terrapin pileata]|uniref:uncharacterized protein LOC128826928 isoform X1 n=1 Tax=Malaclemys terrapin pileata TaxID=2991368 RepID=UPI0023A8FA54|nr:uncharacterized protein LOC128826928 isoform X1 [Malaclemys terrapin pileata]XP_053866477.1 uncharacterized protein LOC128826928 isoform X1 [Malaclemys terrapin pileata]